MSNSKKRFSNKKKLNKTNLQSVPEQSGVYQITNKAGEIQYIGKAGAGRLQERLQEHFNEKDIRGAENFQFIKTSGSKEAESLEKKLIKEKNPKQNEQHNNS